MALTQVAGGLIASGQTITSPTLSSPTINGTPVMGASVITSGTAVASTSGTSINFTSIPSWVKRITVMFLGVSSSGTSYYLIQGGAGSIENTTYVSNANTNANIAGSTIGFILTGAGSAADSQQGTFTMVSMGGNKWTSSHTLCRSDLAATTYGAGTKTFSGTLDRIRITTVNGTDTFDAGSINILYE
jgi:hypothetical protein